MRESTYLDWIRGETPPASSVLVHTGDDAAVCRVPQSLLVLTTDLLLEGVHFTAETCARAVGRKSIARALSDVAAMAQEPSWILGAVALRRGTADDRAEELYRGMRDVADGFGLPIVGGDVAAWDAPTAICITVAGATDLEPICRDGASAGEAIVVTGTFGGSQLGRHLSFTPRIREALALRRAATISAMMDVTDGLAIDLGKLVAASGVAATVEADAVPVSDDAVLAAQEDGRDALAHALGDGEDYELLFTCPEDALEQLSATGVAITRIGRTTEGAGVTVVDAAGAAIEIDAGGYEHVF